MFRRTAAREPTAGTLRPVSTTWTRSVGYNRVLVNSGRTTPARQTSADLSGGMLFGQWLNLNLAGRLEQEVGDTATLTDNWSGTGSLELLPNSRELTVALSDDVNSSFDQRFASAGARFPEPASLELRTSAGSYVTGKVRLELLQRRRTTDNGILKQRESGWQGWLLPVIGAGLDAELTGGYGERVISMPLSYPSLGELHDSGLDAGLAAAVRIPGEDRANGRGNGRTGAVRRSAGCPLKSH